MRLSITLSIFDSTEYQSAYTNLCTIFTFENVRFWEDKWNGFFGKIFEKTLLYQGLLSGMNFCGENKLSKKGNDT